MAMNKKELARMAELEKELREAKALRFTELVEKDIPVPKWNESSSGFIFNAYLMNVSPAWSNSVHHGIGYATEKEHRASRSSASQRGIEMYSTRLLALRAMRNVVEQKAAAELAKIDLAIEFELAKSSS